MYRNSNLLGEVGLCVKRPLCNVADILDTVAKFFLFTRNEFRYTADKNHDLPSSSLPVSKVPLSKRLVMFVQAVLKMDLRSCVVSPMASMDLSPLPAFVTFGIRARLRIFSTLDGLLALGALVGN
jgi:hypothetical protein